MRNTASPTKPKNRFPDAVWREIEQRACDGVPLQTLSDAYGIGIATLNDRSKRYGWKTPARMARRVKAALPAQKTTVAAGAIRGQGQGDQGTLADLCPALITEADSPPEVFQAALARVAQHAIARGLENVPPPRSASELKTWADMHRKASGLDSLDGKRGVMLLFNPMRSVSRRPVRVLEVAACEPTPTTGAPGTPPTMGD